MKDLQAFRQKALKARQAKAIARRAKVKALRDKGLSGPQIAAELGIKLRTVYNDFSILKKEREQAESEQGRQNDNP